MRKPDCLWISIQVRHEPGCTATEDVKGLEVLDLGCRGITRKYVLIVVGLQVPCSGNKGADQRAVIGICQKTGFLVTQLT